MGASLSAPAKIVARSALALALALGACTSGRANEGANGSAAGSSTPASAGPARATTSPAGGRPPRVSPRLDAAPASCPEASIPVERAGPYGELVGRAPVWGGFYARTAHGFTAFAASDAPRTRYGWRIKVLWVMRARGAEEVALLGENTATAEALWIQPTGRRPGPQATLDPSEPGAPSEDPSWLNYPSYLFFPRAGCYHLSVSSSAGRWDMSFGFGR